jgi:hypothetical protein
MFFSTVFGYSRQEYGKLLEKPLIFSSIFIFNTSKY